VYQTLQSDTGQSISIYFSTIDPLGKYKGATALGEVGLDAARPKPLLRIVRPTSEWAFRSQDDGTWIVISKGDNVLTFLGSGSPRRTVKLRAPKNFDPQAYRGREREVFGFSRTGPIWQIARVRVGGTCRLVSFQPMHDGFRPYRLVPLPDGRLLVGSEREAGDDPSRAPKRYAIHELVGKNWLKISDQELRGWSNSGEYLLFGTSDMAGPAQLFKVNKGQ
jgi:hypothetical protein